MTTTEDVIRAAATVGRDVVEGKLAPAALDAAVIDECRELFGTVVGPADPLWSLHGDVARQYLALGGLSVDELSEWLAVARSRGRSQAVAPAETPEERGGPGDTGAAVSSLSEPHSPENDGVGADDETEPEA